jgi:hypothetical protein
MRQDHVEKFGGAPSLCSCTYFLFFELCLPWERSETEHARSGSRRNLTPADVA